MENAIPVFYAIIRTPVHSVLTSMLVVTAILNTGCSSLYSDIAETLRYINPQHEYLNLTEQDIAALPYTAKYAQREGEPRLLVILGFVDVYGPPGHQVEQLSWVTADRETLVTEHGRLIRTVDIYRAAGSAHRTDDDLVATSSRRQDPLRCIITQPQTCPAEWSRSIDYVDHNTPQSTLMRSSFHEQRDVMIELPARTIRGHKIIEKGVFEKTGERFENIFMVAEDGHVVKSVQTPYPGQKPFTFTQVKWVGRDE